MQKALQLPDINQIDVQFLHDLLRAGDILRLPQFAVQAIAIAHVFRITLFLLVHPFQPAQPLSLIHI